MLAPLEVKLVPRAMACCAGIMVKPDATIAIAATRIIIVNVVLIHLYMLEVLLLTFRKKNIVNSSSFN
jgi:hypothetical protein